MKELMKLYDKMTPRELAITAFTNFVAGNGEDTGELERILSKVPRHNYTMTDVEWGRTTDCLFDVAKTYGWIFCELRAIRGESLGIAIASSYRAAILLRKDDTEETEAAFFKAEDNFDAFSERAKEAAAEIHSLHQAIKNLCEERGFPLEEIRAVAGVNDYKLDEGKAQPEYVQKYAEVFQSICDKHSRS